MKTLVEGIWCLVGFGAFLASIDALHRLGVEWNGYVAILISLCLLMSVTWFTHWKP